MDMTQDRMNRCPVLSLTLEEASCFGEFLFPAPLWVKWKIPPFFFPGKHPYGFSRLMIASCHTFVAVSLSKRNVLPGVPTVAQRVKNLTIILEDAGLIPGLRIRCCHKLWHGSQRCSLALALLWLWHRSAAVAPIRPLAWELPYAAGATLKRKKKIHTYIYIYIL